MISKFECQHCQGPIEFQAEDANREAECPHCGKVLIIPSKPVVRLRYEDFPNLKPKRNWKWIPFAIGTISVIGLLAFIYGMANSERVQVFGQAIGFGGGMIMTGLLLIFILFLAALWIVFPLFVFFSLRRTEALLTKIEQNTRR